MSENLRAFIFAAPPFLPSLFIFLLIEFSDNSISTLFELGSLLSKWESKETTLERADFKAGWPIISRPGQPQPVLA